MSSPRPDRLPAQILIVTLLTLMIVGIIVVGVVSVANRDITQSVTSQKYEQVYNSGENAILRVIDHYGDPDIALSGLLTDEALLQAACVQVTPKEFKCANVTDNQGIVTELTISETNTLDRYPLGKDQSFDVILDGFNGEITMHWSDGVAIEFNLYYTEGNQLKVISDLFDDSIAPAFDSAGGDPYTDFLDNHAFNFAQGPNGEKAVFTLSQIKGLPAAGTYTTKSLRLTARFRDPALSAVVDLAAPGLPDQLRRFQAVSYDPQSDIDVVATAVTHIPLLPPIASVFTYALGSAGAVNVESTIASSGTAVGPGGICTAAYLTTHNQAAYIAPGTVQTSLSADGEYRALDKLTNPLTAADLIGIEALYVADGPTTSANQRRSLTSQELDLIRQAYLNGMSVIISGDNGASAATDNSLASRQVAAHLQSYFIYENLSQASNQIAYSASSTTRGWGPEVPFLTSRAINTNGANSTPGLISGTGSPSSPGIESCLATVTAGGATRCVLGYVPRFSGRGFIVLSGNASVPFQNVTVSDITKAACGVPADACGVVTSVSAADVCIGTGVAQVCHYRNGLPLSFRNVSATSKVQRLESSAPQSQVGLYVHFSLSNTETIPVSITSAITAGKNVAIVTDDCAATGGICGTATTGARGFTLQYGVDISGNIPITGFGNVTTTAQTYPQFLGLTRMVFATPSALKYTAGAGTLAPQVAGFSCQYNYGGNCVWGTIELKAGNVIHVITSLPALSSWLGGTNFQAAEAGRMLTRVAEGTCNL